MAIKKVRIVGSGLIGTSIGLGLSAKGIAVEMADKDSRAQKLAQDLVGAAPVGEIQLTIFAVPTSALQEVASAEFFLNPKSKFMDIGSVKTKSVLEVTSSALPVARFCPTHPMAGREVGGAESARGDLFVGRPWIYSPNGVDQDVIEAAKEVIDLLGAKPFELGVAEHDKAVALISHLPQFISSLLAAQLLKGEGKWLELAGAGLRDTTRIAGSDAELWSEIFSLNQAEITPLLLGFEKDLHQMMNIMKYLWIHKASVDVKRSIVTSV